MDNTREPSTQLPSVTIPILDAEWGLPAGAVRVSSKAWFLDEEGYRAIFVGGSTPVLRYALDDEAMHRYAMAFVAKGKYATQEEVAKAFGVSRRWVQALCGKLDREGLAGLVRRPRKDRTADKMRQRICRLWLGGRSPARICQLTGVSVRTIGTILGEEGHALPCRGQAGQLALPQSDAPCGGAPEASETPAAIGEGGLGVEAKSSEAEVAAGGEELCPEEPASAECDPAGPGAAGETGESTQAEGGPAAAGDGEGLAEAAVGFREGQVGCGAGVLLALGYAGKMVARARQVYGALQPGQYGLRSLVVGLLAMALLRVKNAESLKGEDPSDLGRLLGQERVFEMKTLRRKLSEVASLRKAAEWHAALAEDWVAEEGEELATLYVDGHMRAYYGKKEVAKGWFARRRMCLTGTSDTWVNTRQGEPLLRITHEGHPALSTVLPEILQDVRAAIGDRRCTVVFDRGGCAGSVLRQVLGQGFDFITYAKVKGEDLAEEAFQKHVVGEGKSAKTYWLGETQVQVSGYGEMRLIARRQEGRGQTHIYTNKEGAPVLEVALEIFDRWRQENFFKYMRSDYALDALVDYGWESVGDRLIPNPQRCGLDREVKQARAKLQKAQAARGELLAAREVKESKQTSKRTSRRLTELGEEVARLEAKVQALLEGRSALPTHISLSQTQRRDERKLSTERKLFTDLIKMGAYRLESLLTRLAEGELRRNGEEGHAFVENVLKQGARLQVEGNRVEVLFRPMSAPRYTQALVGLCEKVNATDPRFPETDYRLHFSVSE